MCDCQPDPRRTFCPHGRANLSALRSVAVSPLVYGRPYKKSSKDRRPLNSWERGLAFSERPGGTQMPYLDEKGERIGIKDWVQTYRRKFRAEGLA